MDAGGDSPLNYGKGVRLFGSIVVKVEGADAHALVGPGRFEDPVAGDLSAIYGGRGPASVGDRVADGRTLNRGERRGWRNQHDGQLVVGKLPEGHLLVEDGLILRPEVNAGRDLIH